MPDHLSFLPEMNCYGLPEDERDYYRLAHRHRTVLNRVPYNQNGQMPGRLRPVWDSRRLSFDWSSWDRRFGPLLDGSAFADLPRKSVPVECFYLPLHENWPSPMEGNYNGDYWADRAFPSRIARRLSLPRGRSPRTCRQGLDRDALPGLPQQQEQLQGQRLVARLVAVAPGRAGQLPGLLGAALFRPGLSRRDQPGIATNTRTARVVSPRLVFRADISRPQWRRDSLDGLLDDHVVGSAMRDYPRLVFERKRTLGEIILEYGSTNPVEGSNVQPLGVVSRRLVAGGRRDHSLANRGNADSWNHADELALFYPHPEENSAGAIRNKSLAPIPSIRLKAYRRGQQDVEYLTLWSQLHEQPRWAVGPQVRAALKLAGTRRATGFSGADDAGMIDYARLRPQDSGRCGSPIAQDLSSAHPAPKSKWSTSARRAATRTSLSQRSRRE